MLKWLLGQLTVCGATETCLQLSDAATAPTAQVNMHEPELETTCLGIVYSKPLGAASCDLPAGPPVSVEMMLYHASTGVAAACCPAGLLGAGV